MGIKIGKLLEIVLSQGGECSRAFVTRIVTSGH
jgi:hypothetical protein